MALTFGQIQEFSPENETIGAYLERVELYFQANGVAEGRRVAAFLSIIGGKNYILLRNILHVTRETQRQVARGPVNGLITFTPFHVPCHMTHRGGGARVPAQCKWHRRIKCSSLFKVEKKKKEHITC